MKAVSSFHDTYQYNERIIEEFRLDLNPNALNMKINVYFDSQLDYVMDYVFDFEKSLKEDSSYYEEEYFMPQLSYSEFRSLYSEELVNQQCVICWQEFQIDEGILIFECCQYLAHLADGELWIEMKEKCPNCGSEIYLRKISNIEMID